jgi:ABC-type transporter Mla subunit MlaD
MVLNAWQVGLLVLIAVFIGAAIPALVQLRATLRTIQETVKATGPALSTTLSKLEIGADRIEKLTRGFDGGDREVAGLVKRLEEINAILARLSRAGWVATSIGAAVGPAVSAAVRSYQTSKAEEKEASQGTRSNGQSWSAEPLDHE